MFEREENPCNIKKADIVVGIASYKEADSISYPAQQASIGLKKYFPDRNSVIINCDNHSPDGTEEAFLKTDTDIAKIYITTPPDTPGKGYNFENLFRKTLELGASALVCVDADLKSITPEWIRYFAEPVIDGYDYVTPIYSRHKYDGTITNNICFPLIYSLFCQNIRQPIGGDFALSSNLIKYLICQPWHRTTEEYGIDIFMSLNAVAGGFKTCATGLGAKIHKPSAPKLGPMFVQVVSTAFLIITRNFLQWKQLSSIHSPPQFGLQELAAPQELTIDKESIKNKSITGFHQHKDTLSTIISSSIFSELKNMYDSGEINITIKSWMTIVYDIIAAFTQSDDKNTIIDAFKSLYFGRTYSFMNKTWDSSTAEAEKEIISQADCFYKNRQYLIDKLETQLS